MQSLGFEVQGLESKVWGLGPGFRVWQWSRVLSVEFRVLGSGLGFRDYGVGCWVKGVRF